jgi:type II secretory pathway component PulJ
MGRLCRVSEVARERSAGSSLIETLVALVVAAILLTAAWAWLWSVIGTSRQYGTRAQTVADLAFAQRLITRELRATVRLLPEATAGCSAAALTVALRSPGASAEDTVSYVWDPGRAVLWRKTSSTYVAEHVSLFRISYFDGQGAPVVPADAGRLSAPQAATVARVLVQLRLHQGDADVGASWQVALEAGQ